MMEDEHERVSDNYLNDSRDTSLSRASTKQSNYVSFLGRLQ